MNPSPLRRRAALWTFKVAEGLLACFALASAAAVADHGRWSPALFWDEVNSAPVFTATVLLTWHIVLLVRGLYASHRLEETYSQLLDLLACVSLCTGVVTVGALFWHPRLATAEFVTAFWMTLALVVVVERSLLRPFLRSLHAHSRNLRIALIVGSGERAQRFARTLRKRADLGYRLIGCVDDKRAADETLLPWLGSLDELSKVLSETVIDEVFIALPMRSSYEQIQQAVHRCEEQGTLVTMPTDFFAARLARARLGAIGHQPVLYLSAVPENDSRLLVKRCIDFFGALLLLMLLCPVLLAIALAVRSTSNGPAIFMQTRVGLNKRPFKLYKFRTMAQDAEAQQAGLEHRNEVSGPVFKIRNDPRVTRIGVFLRRTSLDELPQLWNVLIGEMSVVGPRPLPMRDVNAFREDWQRRRFSVRPGLTCLWQLSGRSDVSFERWMELDLQYIDQWSLWLDFGIMAKTVPVVLRGSGAY